MGSEYAPFQSMSTSRDTPNPLRPYYVPPSIGGSSARTANATAAGSTSKVGIGRSAKDLLSDLDYGGPLLDRDGPSVAEMGKKVMDQAIWKYTSVLLAQPFDVAKTILQVRLAEDEEWAPESISRSRQSIRLEEYSRSDDDESDSDSPSYFQSSKATSSRYENGSPRRKRSRGRPSPPPRSESATPVPPDPQHAYKLRIRQHDSILETLGALWNQSGATGLWKATNATFVYNVLLKALESWTRSLLCALANLPDPGALAAGPSELVASAVGGINVTDSPSPLLSLGVAVAASAIAGLLLSPLDLVRTRLIITPNNLPPRATIQLLRSLPSLFVPTSLLPITFLHSTLPTLVTTSAPLVLRSQLRIDPITTPTTYSIASFASSTAELFLKLPLETVLRRGQVAVLAAQHKEAYRARTRQPSSTSSTGSTYQRLGLMDSELRTIVTPGPYKGVWGTVYTIVFEEGRRVAPTKSSSSSSLAAPDSRFGTPVAPSARTPKSAVAASREKKGQGVSGLWRGWRVGMWGLCGVWLAAAMGSGKSGGEF